MSLSLKTQGAATLRLLGKPFGGIGGAICGAGLGLFIFVALFAPLLAPYAYDAQDLARIGLPPSAENWFGTDEFGRDVLSRVIYGARISLSVGLTAVALSASAGILIGALCGYFGGRFDRITMAAIDLTWCFPEILLALVLVAILGPGLNSTVIAIAVAYLAQFTRLTRTQVRALKGETFVEVSRCLGAGHAHILLRHLLPNALAPVIVVAMLTTGDAILLEATLGFFGMGAQPPTPSWGAMMSSGSAQLFNAPWVVIIPGLFVALSVIFINVYGDAILAALDVKNRIRRA
ncbi:ABC transporter permease [Novispirillum itersonii]|uniref:ABC-type dipeptide/oligopeptide/nickel transport system permease subunit n=1 Tax=Novispirillum itersonii TaxID=189 RepID=A0A7W9ZKB1_NOVIT|nr:ABC transporter permease [Novispirillum itersonii]MBB6211814.1 ABC-type dipeptide/oligopeptide/nickel transport system permease subunit [Novispirillum itersonii]